jgi:uroporphyrinogen III methyltransferase/synthase
MKTEKHEIAENNCKQERSRGFVSLVGAGPGDEGLITVRGAACLQEADVVVYDHLVSGQLLSYCRRECESIYVGKQAGSHTYRQDDINQLLIRYAQQGKLVVRLKGGDPFLFGRGGEEALALAQAGVAFEIVPGVTAGVAAPACAGIPVTHRDVASSVTFITGHEAADKADSSLDWEGIARGGDTLVFYMGVRNIEPIMEALMRYGRGPDTPAALIRWGTTARQQTITATVATIAEEVARTGIQPPAIIMVGEVVRYREQLRWFDTRPLFGRRIVVTRSRAQASELAASLTAAGAQVDQFPTIDIHPVEDVKELDFRLDRISDFAWIVFTSVNGVRIFFERLFERGMDTRSLSGVQIAVIGKATGLETARYGINPDLVPDQFTSEGTIEAFRSQAIDVKGKKVLLPGSAIAREYIPRKLREMGAIIEQVAVYENRQPRYSREQVEALFDPLPDLVTFTSSSTVEHFVSICTTLGLDPLLSQIMGASIGPITSETARKYGITIGTEAETHTIAGLVEAIHRHLDGGEQV